MGGLFSRAYKRLTQGGQQRSRNESQSDQPAAGGARDRPDSKGPTRSPLVESIPVGQSIDSAEYRDLEGNRSVLCSPRTADKENERRDENEQEGEKKRGDVEEAVIKIQALVRGHLTRKALKDGTNQPAAAPNGLGQSQFDEESLTKKLAELGGVTASKSQPTTSATTTATATTLGRNSEGSRVPLESIAELIETSAASLGGPVAQQTASELAELVQKQAQEEQEQEAAERRQRLAGGTARAISDTTGRQTSSSSSNSNWFDRAKSREFCGSRDSGVSPVPSEANASIDLNTCDTPASASIDILDHNIRPTERLASVLHPPAQQQQQQQVPIEITASSSGADHLQLPADGCATPDSLDSEEAAAIRIQSAFRGYRTRKHSPYRTRSPNSASLSEGQAPSLACNSNSSGKRESKLRPQEAVVMMEDEDDERPAEQRVPSERRESRSKQRDIVSRSEADESISGLDESAEEDTNTPGTVRELPAPQTRASRPTESGSIDNNNNNNDSTDLADGSLSELAPNTLEGETGTMSAALEAAPSSTAPHQQCHLQPADSADDETSLDMDSCVLGAALSLSDEVATWAPIAAGQAAGQPPADCDSVELGLESEARRLVDQLQSGAEKRDDEHGLGEPHEAATNQLEAALAALETAAGQSGSQNEPAMNADEQLAIELESDDIERRDPRGQASEQRTRSPQISTEMGPSIELAADADDACGLDENNTRPAADEDMVEASAAGLLRAAKVNDSQPTSGRSSPAADSSNGSQDSDRADDNDDDGGDDVGQATKRQPQQQQQGQPKSKRRNRNKKRGKK